MYIPFKTHFPRNNLNPKFLNEWKDLFVCYAKTLKRKTNNNSIHVLSFERFLLSFRQDPDGLATVGLKFRFIFPSNRKRWNKIFDVWKYVFSGLRSHITEHRKR